MKHTSIFILLIFVSLVCKAEMGEYTRCLAKFELKDGKQIELYFETSGVPFYDKLFKDEFHFKNFVLDSIDLVENYYTNYINLHCPKDSFNQNYYTVLQKDFIDIHRDSIKGINLLNFDILPIGSHYQPESEELVKKLIDPNCVCKKFQLDMAIHDEGGDSIGTLFLFSSSVSGNTISKEIKSIKNRYNSELKGKPYSEKEENYRSFINQIKDQLKEKMIYLIEHFE